MTNAEKYLKEGVDAKEIWHKYQEFLMNNDKTENACTFVEFFEEKVQPTLTEDERVILRNIDQTVYQKIGRDKKESIFDLVLTGEDVRCVEIDDILKPDLFQFIKERRRIFNRGVAR